VPLLLILLAIAEVESHTTGSGEAVRVVLEEVGYGVAAGLGVGTVVAAIALLAGRPNLIAASWAQVIPVAGAFLAYGVAAALGGSGFIAAFVAGMTFGYGMRGDPAELCVLNEELGEILNGVTFIVFGAVLLGPALKDLSWSVVLYALLSLTLVRMIPVAIAMIGLRARRPTIAFVGWFGPRGLASIVSRLSSWRSRSCRTSQRSCWPPTSRSQSPCSCTASPPHRSRTATRAGSKRTPRSTPADGERARRTAAHPRPVLQPRLSARRC
jgi:NhaP-type Na+/H+ or K+/H+ antiporter